MSEKSWPPASYVLTPNDWSDLRALLHAHSEGDDRWVRQRQEMHRGELARGESSVEMIGYCLAVMEQIAKANRVPAVLLVQQKLFFKRLRTEIYKRKTLGEPTR